MKGLTHRYEDKVLFLALDTCPVYCRYCTRAYAVGGDTDTAEKISIKATKERWNYMFEYLKENEQIQDVVISGGDSYRLKASQVREIGEELLKIDHIRRFRFATKGLAIMPMKILTDVAWTDAVCRISNKARKQHKEVCIHTHFNHSNEITGITQEAMNILFSRGVKVRNQSVFQNHVNDSAESMIPLVKKLSYIKEKYGVIIIEDCAHAIGAKDGSILAGSCSFSDCTIFSFHPVKLITTGEGGMLLTDNSNYAKKFQSLRNLCFEKKRFIHNS